MQGPLTFVAAVVLTLLPAASAVAGIEQLKLTPKTVATVLLGPKVDLGCVRFSRVGSSPSGFTLTNTHSVTIPAGTRVGLHYTRSQLESGGWQYIPTDIEWQIDSDWGPGQNRQSIRLDSTDNYPACSAWFYGGLPDLELLGFSVSQGNATLKVRNNNPFVSAPQYLVRIKAMKCGQIELAKVDRAFPAIPGGGVRVFTIAVPTPSGGQYYDAYVDLNNAIRESNENNNGYTGVGVCVY